jgi:hypothetical protein
MVGRDCPEGALGITAATCPTRLTLGAADAHAHHRVV